MSTDLPATSVAADPGEHHNAFDAQTTTSRNLDGQDVEQADFATTEFEPSSERDQPSTVGDVGLGISAAAVAVGASLDAGRSIEHDDDGSLRTAGVPKDEPPWSFDNVDARDQPYAESPVLGTKSHQVVRDSGYQTSSQRASRQSIDSTDRALPEIRPVTSRGSLHSRRSNEALHISTDTGPEWNLKTPKRRGADRSAVDETTLHARTPSRETQDTPLESTSRNRASYLFQTTPENLRNIDADETTRTPRVDDPTNVDYFANGARYSSSEHGSFANDSAQDLKSPLGTGIASPRIPLDSIPEEHLALKRSFGDLDGREPDQKASRRTATPQDIRARERALSPTVQTPTIAGRSISNPIPGEEVVGGERSLHRKLSRPLDPRSPSVASNRSNTSASQWRSPNDLRSYSRASDRSTTPSLRRTSLSGDLRAASRRGDSGSTIGARSSPKTIPFEAPPTPPSNDDEVMDEGASRAAAMSDVFVRTHPIQNCFATY